MGFQVEGRVGEGWRWEEGSGEVGWSEEGGGGGEVGLWGGEAGGLEGVKSILEERGEGLEE